MSELLLDWLNTECGLDRPVDDFETAFENGFLLGCVLHHFNQLPRSARLVDKHVADAKISNFCLLEPELRRLGIVFDAKTAIGVMVGRPGIAARLIYQVKSAIEALGDEVGVSPDGRRRLLNVSLKSRKPKYEEASRMMFEKSLREMVPSENEVLMARHLARFTEAGERNHRLAIEMTRQDIADFYAEKEAIRAAALQKTRLDHEALEEAEEAGIELWEKNQARAAERRLYHTRAKKHVRRKRKLEKLAERDSAAATVRDGVDDFERRLAGMRDAGLLEEDSVAAAALAEERPLEELEAKLLTGIVDASKLEAVQLSIRTRKREHDASTLNRARRRREFLADLTALSTAKEKERRDKRVMRKLLRRTKTEDELAHQLQRVHRFKAIITADRDFRAKQYEQQAEADAATALARDAAFYRALQATRSRTASAHATRRRLHDDARRAAAHCRAAAFARSVLERCMVGSLAIAEVRRQKGGAAPLELRSQLLTLVMSTLPLHAAEEAVDEAEGKAAGDEEKVVEEGDDAVSDAAAAAAAAAGGDGIPAADEAGDGDGEAAAAAAAAALRRAHGPAEDVLPVSDAALGSLLDDVELQAYLHSAAAWQAGTLSADGTAAAEQLTAALADAAARKKAMDKEAEESKAAAAAAAGGRGGRAAAAAAAAAAASGSDDVSAPTIAAPTPLLEPMGGSFKLNALTGQLVMDAWDIAAPLLLPPSPPPPALPRFRLQLAVFGQLHTGCSTQASRLADAFNLVRLDCEQLLQWALAPEGSAAGGDGDDVGAAPAWLALPPALSTELTGLLASGAAVGDQHYLALLLAAMRCLPADCDGWVLDGFPTSMPQARALEAALTGHDDAWHPWMQRQPSALAPAPDGSFPPTLPPPQSGLDAAFFLQLPEGALSRRVLGHLVHSDSGDRFHMDTAPPPADEAMKWQLRLAEDSSLLHAVAPDLQSVQRAQLAQLLSWWTRFSVVRGVDTHGLSLDDVTATLSETVTELRDGKLAVEAAAKAAAEAEEAAQRAAAAAKAEAEAAAAAAAAEAEAKAKADAEAAAAAAAAAEEGDGEPPRADSRASDGASAKRGKHGRKHSGAAPPAASGEAAATEELVCRRGATVVLADDQLPLRPALARLLHGYRLQLEQQYRTALCRGFSQLRGEAVAMLRHFAARREAFLAFLRRPDRKQRLLSDFQAAYNAVETDMRFTADTRSELHLRISELRAALWDVCAQRRQQAVDELKQLAEERWVEDHAVLLQRLVILLMEAELQRYHGVTAMLSDAAHDAAALDLHDAMEGDEPPLSLLPALQAAEAAPTPSSTAAAARDAAARRRRRGAPVEEETDGATLQPFALLDAAAALAAPLLDAAADSGSAVGDAPPLPPRAMPRVEVSKAEKPSRGGGRGGRAAAAAAAAAAAGGEEEKEEHAALVQLHDALAQEAALLRFRLQRLDRYGRRIVSQLLTHAHTVVAQLDDALRERDGAERAAVDGAVALLREAVETPRTLPHRLLLSGTEFIVDMTVRLLPEAPPPSPPPQLPLHAADPRRFSAAQLRSLGEALSQAAMGQRTLPLDVAVDVLLTLAAEEELPAALCDLPAAELAARMRSFDPSNQRVVDGVAIFAVAAANALGGLPELGDLLSAGDAMRNKMTTHDGTLSREQFMSVTFWFQAAAAAAAASDSTLQLHEQVKTLLFDALQHDERVSIAELLVLWASTPPAGFAGRSGLYRAFRALTRDGSLDHDGAAVMFAGDSPRAALLPVVRASISRHHGAVKEESLREDPSVDAAALAAAFHLGSLLE